MEQIMSHTKILEKMGKRSNKSQMKKYNGKIVKKKKKCEGQKYS